MIINHKFLILFVVLLLCSITPASALEIESYSFQGSMDGVEVNTSQCGNDHLNDTVKNECCDGVGWTGWQKLDNSILSSGDMFGKSTAITTIGTFLFSLAAVIKFIYNCQHAGEAPLPPNAPLPTALLWALRLKVSGYAVAIIGGCLFLAELGRVFYHYPAKIEKTQE